MSENTRRILVFVFIIFFFLISFYSLFALQGYIFDFKKTKIVQTGGILIKTTIKDTDIFLNETYLGKISPLSKKFFIKDLLPSEYQIKVEKKDYYPWEKRLKSIAGLITRTDPITLFKKDPDSKIISLDIKDFYLAKNNKIFLLKKKDGKEQILKYNEKKINVLESNNRLNFSSIIFANSQKIFLKGGLEQDPISQKKDCFFVFDLSILTRDSKKGPTPPLSFCFDKTLKLNFSNQNLIFYQKRIIVNSSKENSLFAFDLETKTEKKIIKNLLSYKISEQGLIIWLDKFGFLNISNSNGKVKKQLNSSPLKVKDNSEYNIYFSNDLNRLFVLEDDSLYLFDNEKKIFSKIKNNINEIAVSPDNKKLVLITKKNKILIYLLENEKESLKNRGAIYCLIDENLKIDKFYWYNSDYLVLTNLTEIKIFEIDNRDKINLVNYRYHLFDPYFSLKTLKKLTFSNRSLYLLSNSILRKITFN